MPGLRKVQLSYEARAWPKMSLDGADSETVAVLSVELLSSEEVCCWDGNVDGH